MNHIKYIVGLWYVKYYVQYCNTHQQTTTYYYYHHPFLFFLHVYKYIINNTFYYVHVIFYGIMYYP